MAKAKNMTAARRPEKKTPPINALLAIIKILEPLTQEQKQRVIDAVDALLRKDDY